MNGKPRTTVIGGGLAGLVAAITVAEQGGAVELHESHAAVGGRARSTAGPFKANLGPHVLYCDGPLWDWLIERDLVPSFARTPLQGLRLRWRGEIRRTPPVAMVRGIAKLRHREPPVDLSFREWVESVAGPDAADALCGFAGVATFTSDPGRWSAAFVWERVRRALRVPPAARYVTGGWTSMVEALAERATSLGVRIQLSSPVDELPDARPVIVATDLRAARHLLGDETLDWTSGRAALLDVGVEASARDPFVVSDLDQAGWAERFSAADPTLAPPGHSLLQCQVGTRDGESLDAAVRRLERLLDDGFAEWRPREVWRRRAVVDGRTGALDPPGTTWRDRPAIDRGDGVYLCGDMVAAPGLLGEVSWASAVTAGRAAAVASGRGAALQPAESQWRK